MWDTRWANLMPQFVDHTWTKRAQWRCCVQSVAMSFLSHMCPAQFTVCKGEERFHSISLPCQIGNTSRSKGGPQLTPIDSVEILGHTFRFTKGPEIFVAENFCALRFLFFCVLCSQKLCALRFIYVFGGLSLIDFRVLGSSKTWCCVHKVCRCPKFREFWGPEVLFSLVSCVYHFFGGLRFITVLGSQVHNFLGPYVILVVLRKTFSVLCSRAQGHRGLFCWCAKKFEKSGRKLTRRN